MTQFLLFVSALAVFAFSSPSHALPYGNIETTTLVVGDFGEPRGLSAVQTNWKEVESLYTLATAPAGTALSMEFETVRSYFNNSGRRAILLSTANLSATVQNFDLEILETKFDILIIPALSTINILEFELGLKQISNRVDQDRAFFLFDLPVGVKPNMEGTRLQMIKNTKMVRVASYAPSLRLANGTLIPNSGAMAGAISRVDSSIGPWKAAAGTQIRFASTEALEHEPTPTQCTSWGANLPVLVNCLRTSQGRVIPWGARLAQIGDPDNRYISIRRAIDYFEHAVAKNLAWVQTAPNTEATWKTIRENLEWDFYSFWQSKALVGATGNEAFFVRCGLGQTMTNLDVLEGRVIVEFGTALLKPSEFQISRVVLRQTP